MRSALVRSPFAAKAGQARHQPVQHQFQVGPQHLAGHIVTQAPGLETARAFRVSGYVIS